MKGELDQLDNGVSLESKAGSWLAYFEKAFKIAVQISSARGTSLPHPPGALLNSTVTVE